MGILDLPVKNPDYIMSILDRRVDKMSREELIHLAKWSLQQQFSKEWDFNASH